MYKDKKILIGKNKNTEVNLLLNKANRHGLITGASGSGKTITLKVLAESFSEAGVPVILSDVKGDLAATSLMGEKNENIEKRINNLKLTDFKYNKYPVTFFDIFAESGHPIRATVSSIGSKLLARMLNLTDTQEGVLSIVFRIAEDEQMELIDLKDLKAMLTYVGDKRKDYTLNYGNVSLQSIGAIQRNILSLEEEGGDFFFGKPSFDIKDFIHFDCNTGYGHVNIIHSVKLFQKPTLYSTFLLWMLTSLYNTMPEVGDLDKPKLVFFFDEAHLLFSEIPDYLLKQIIQIVKLIRSKGIGLYFISQTPSDIPDEILGQLGNRIQHVLRSYTKTDEKVIKAAADSYRSNPNFDTEEAIKTLATGEALISVQDEEGQPTIVEKVTILPPQSKMGIIEENTRSQLINTSWLYGKYENKIDDVSAYEKITQIVNDNEAKEQSLKKGKEKTKKTKTEKYVDKLTNKTINTLGRKIGNKIFNSLFK